MSGDTAVKNLPVEKSRQHPAKVIAVVLVLVVALTVAGGLTYFSFARQPVVLPNVVVVGPECESQPAIRVEASYLAAKKAGGAGPPPSLAEFAGIKFYRNVPWGAAEQTAPIGPR